MSSAADVRLLAATMPTPAQVGSIFGRHGVTREHPAGHQRGGALRQDRRTGRRLRRAAGRAGEARPSAGRDPARLSRRRALPACRSSRPASTSTSRSAARWCRARCCKSHLPGSTVPVYLVQQEQYFDRPELYRRERQGLQRQLRAVRVLLPGRAGGDPPVGSAGRRDALQRLADRPDSGVS